MKTGSIVVAALVGALAASSASAQFYAGVSVGKTDFNPDPSDWAFGPPFITSIDDTDTGWKIFGGYQFTRHWGVEVAYTDFGSYTATNIAPGLDSGTANVKVKSGAAFVTGKLPLTERFALMAKIGASVNESKSSFASQGVLLIPAASNSSTKTSLAWGAGASFAFNKNVAVRLEYEDYGDAGKSNFLPGTNTSRSQPHLISLGAQFSF